MAILEQVKSSLSAMAADLWGTLCKTLIIIIVAFSVFVFIKYFQVFTSTIGDSVDQVSSELDAVQMESLTRMNGSETTFLRTFMIVVLSIGKTIIVLVTTFVSFWLIEAHAVLPTTVLCFLYGAMIGCGGGYYYAKGRMPWSGWLPHSRQGRGVERVYYEKRVEERTV